MYETLNHIFSVDAFTFYVVGGLTVWAAVLVRLMTDSTALAFLFMPFINFGALAGIFVCRELSVVFSQEKDSNLIVSALVGMIVALLIMLLATRLVYASSALKAKSQLARQGLADRTTHP